MFSCVLFCEDFYRLLHRGLERYNGMKLNIQFGLIREL